MVKKNVLILRTNKVDPDPRVEKEANSLLINKKINVEVLAWDRTEKYKYRKEFLGLHNGDVVIHRIGIPAGWGVGIKKNSFAFMQYSIQTCLWLIKNHKHYDIIHACDLQTVIPSVIPLCLFKKKLIYDIFDYFSDTAHGNRIILKISKWFETKVINKATATIICSEKRKEQIEPARPKRLEIIHNSPSISQIDTETNHICKTISKKAKLVYVGNLVEDRCIKEIVELARIHNDIEFHIGGIGSLENYVKSSSEVLSNLYYYGKMPYSDVISLEKECDIMIAFYDQKVPNHKYAAPNKFYEALSLGKPIIMLHNTGVDDVIDRYNLGVTVNQDIQSMSAGIEYLLERKQTWKNIEEMSQRLFVNEYSWDIMETRLNQLYDNILG